MLLGGRVLPHASCADWVEASCACRVPSSLVGRKLTFVEIGAHDGRRLSNSWFFERVLGWRGMCIEANPKIYETLRLNRPGCTSVNALVARQSDFNSSRVPFISFSHPEGAAHGTTAWESGMSGIEGRGPHQQTNSLKEARVWAAHISKYRHQLRAERHMLPVIPFSELLAANGFRHIDFMSLDVEGGEHSVLRSIAWNETVIRLLAIETVTKETSSASPRSNCGPEAPPPYPLKPLPLACDARFTHPANGSTAPTPRLPRARRSDRGRRPILRERAARAGGVAGRACGVEAAAAAGIETGSSSSLPR
jgi:FkbM family methyltransferase